MGCIHMDDGGLAPILGELKADKVGMWSGP